MYKFTAKFAYILSVFLIFTPLCANTASFDCGKARFVTEKIICEGGNLSELDDKQSFKYRVLGLEMSDKKQFNVDQELWLQQRNKCLENRDCIESAYKKRLNDLTFQIFPLELRATNGECNSECPITRCSKFFINGEISQQLWDSVVKDEYFNVREYLARGADPDICGEDYARPLHLAVQMQKIEMVHDLLEAKANPNSLNCAGHTPLSIAASINNEEAVIILLLSGADVELDQPLKSASLNGHINIVKILLTHGASPNSISNDSTSLSVAAWRGHYKIVQILLEAGADPNFGTSSPLFEAVGAFRVVPPTSEEQKRALQVVEILVQYGAQVNVKTAGQSPLRRARELNEFNIVKFLESVGAKE